MTTTKRDLSLIALLVTVVLWASAFVGIRELGDTFTPGALTLGRLIVGAIALTFIARPHRQPFPTGRPLALVILYGVLWFGVYNIFLNAGERHLDAGTSALLVNIAPALVALMAGFLLKEGFPRALIIGIVVAFAGVALIAVGASDSSSTSTASTAGVLLCVGAAIVYAISVLAQKVVLQSVEPVMSVWLGCVIGMIMCVPFAGSLVHQLGDASTHDVLWLAYLGIFPTAIGFSTWSYALKRLSSGQTTSTTYLVPAVATLISWIVLDEVPAALAFVGGAMCLIGVAITRAKRRQPKAETVPARP